MRDFLWRQLCFYTSTIPQNIQDVKSFPNNLSINTFVEVVFFKGHGDFISFLIRFFTSGPYSHVVLKFSDGTIFQSSGKFPNKNVFLLSSHEILHTYKSEEWLAVKLSVSQQEEQEILETCLSFLGLPFNYLGLFRFIFPFIPKSLEKKNSKVTPFPWIMHMLVDGGRLTAVVRSLRLAQPPIAEPGRAKYWCCRASPT